MFTLRHFCAIMCHSEISPASTRMKLRKRWSETLFVLTFINFSATSCSQIFLSNAAAFVGIFPVLLLRDAMSLRLLV